jgi:hypothetical protein
VNSPPAYRYGVEPGVAAPSGFRDIAFRGASQTGGLSKAYRFKRVGDRAALFHFAEYKQISASGDDVYFRAVGVAAGCVSGFQYAESVKAQKPSRAKFGKNS